MTITVGCPQTNRKTDTGKTLKPWPVLVDHYNITIELLEFSAVSAIRASQDAVNEIRLNRTVELLKRVNTTSALDKKQEENIALRHNSDFLSIPGDLSRAQHYEFLISISELLNTPDIAKKIQDCDLFQRYAYQTESMEVLQRNGSICDTLLI